MKDDTRHAYAVLGLASGASHDELKRQHRKLVKKWHPDRFTSDPAAQAIASDQLARINAAYRLLVESGGRDVETKTTAPPKASTTTPFTPHGRMSREEIDRIVASINDRSDGEMEGLRDWLRQRLETARTFAANRRVRVAAAFLLMMAVVDEVEFLLGLPRYELGCFAVALLLSILVWAWQRR